MKRWYFVLIVFSISNIVLIGSELVPIPTEIKVDNQKVQLGKKLFLDPILSKDKTLSCMSCHNLKRNGADRVRRTKGIDGQVGYFNVPTVYNAVYNFRQFWDGRAKDLKDQALQPIVNPVEMGNTMENALKSLKADNTYVSMFNIIYEDGITEENLAEVITEFEKTLITPNAPFDKYLRGNKNAISQEAKEGYALFKEKGCITCHHGVNVGGNMYNKFGVISNIKSKSLGRYNVTKRERDKYYFKVPSLRNVERTAPYFHDGRHAKLEDAVKDMAYFQLGRPISDEEIAKIVAFLRSLNGELPQGITP
jgi:cytochrome c peroxidase